MMLYHIIELLDMVQIEILTERKIFLIPIGYILFIALVYILLLYLLLTLATNKFV